MQIVCDLMASIMPEIDAMSSALWQPDFPPPFPHYDPRIYLNNACQKIGLPELSAKNHVPRNLSSTKF